MIARQIALLKVNRAFSCHRRRVARVHHLDLETIIRKVTARFFANDSPAAVFLNEYVKGKATLPLTTQGIKGLPRAWRRGKTTAPESRPNFLFLDLPTPSTDSIPERFLSNVILQELEKTEAQGVPVFIVSGCGKTRSVVEMLCLQWGFYFNASDKDLGSDDLSYLATSILVVKGHFQFKMGHPSSPTMFEDVFMSLFKILFGRLQERTISELSLTAIVSEELLSVRSRLTALKYPNFTNKCKLRLVVDEAQILGDQGNNLFESTYVESELRPLLSPVLHGFRRPGDRGELTVIYCGTGLSIQTLHWAQSSGDGVKEEGSMTFPHLEFPGWTNQASVQSFIERLKDQFPDNESRNAVDALFPEESVRLLHQRLGGRFRPIVTAIERIIRIGDPDGWKSAIDDTENMLISCKEERRRGNLIGELKRVEDKIRKHQGEFSSLSSIEETLGLFIYRWAILGETSIVLEDEAQLVEAAFGRIKMFRGNATTVLDEAFVLKATKNYFKEKDPLFMKTAERAIIPDQLTGDVAIVGYDEHLTRLAISFKDISTYAFMEAHVKGISKQGESVIPPFYFPAPNVSGPDVIFFVQIGNRKYPCFVQLKLRQTLVGKDAIAALETTSGQAVQVKMNKEHEKEQQMQHPPQLQDYCPNGVYISMVIAYPAEVITFRQVVRPDPTPELGTDLQRVMIKIDDSNFAQIFPASHV
ncbi:hypothetical protein BGZ46_010474, partial [Entomortierella lignicola]